MAGRWAGPALMGGVVGLIGWSAYEEHKLKRGVSWENPGGTQGGGASLNYGELIKVTRNGAKIYKQRGEYAVIPAHARSWHSPESFYFTTEWKDAVAKAKGMGQAARGGRGLGRYPKAWVEKDHNAQKFFVAAKLGEYGATDVATGPRFANRAAAARAAKKIQQQLEDGSSLDAVRRAYGYGNAARARTYNKRVSKCISGKVRGEGWNQRQAVAACLNMDREKSLRPDGSYIPVGGRATTYFKGDKARYTGKSEVLHGGRFYEVVLVEGHRKGEKKWVHNAPGANITSRGRGAGKKPTYAKARKDILAYLGTEGWDLSSPRLKVPHATSPGGHVRLYFKAQSVHLDTGKPFSLGASRSLWVDIRALPPSSFLRLVQRVMRRGEW